MGDGMCTLYSIASQTTAIKIWVAAKLSGTAVYPAPSVLVIPTKRAAVATLFVSLKIDVFCQ